MAYKEVTALYRNQRDDIIKLQVGEQTIKTTDNHPFWVDGKGWVFAGELQAGDKLQKADGSNLTIDKVEFVKLDEKVTVYNFKVADYHTYYVTDIGIWVHNTNCFTNISFQIDLFKRYEGHIFSADHIKDWIMKLGKDRQSIFSSITGKIGSVDPSKLAQGSNQMHTKINGYDVTIRFYVDANGKVINVNTFMGTAERVIGNLVK